jgi:hypothetical protein
VGRTTTTVEKQQWHSFYNYIIKHNSMKKYSIIVAVLMILGVSVSSCHASGKIGTKHHEVGAGAHIK